MSGTMDEYDERVAEDVIAEFNRRAWSSGGEALLVTRLRAIPLSSEKIAKVLRIIDGTCCQCWDGDADCQCRNDE